MPFTERFTVAGLLRANAQERPDSTMFVDRGETWTWAGHKARASRVANALEAEGLEPAGRVAFLDRNGIEFFETMFGGALAGIVIVPVNWRLAADEMAAVIDDSRAEVLIVHTEYVQCVAAMSSGLPYVRRIVVVGGQDGSYQSDIWGDANERYGDRSVDYEDWIHDQPDTDPGHVPDPEEVSLQLYTSGTTGLPKGVMLTNSNLSTAIGAADGTFKIDSTIVSLVAMPLFHIGGTGWALCAMSRGGKSVILRDTDPNMLLELVEKERVSHMFVVPAVLMFLLAMPRIETTDLSSLREIFYGASPIAEDVLVACLRVFKCSFTQVYGMTETTGAICALLPKDHDPDGPRRNLLRSAGKPLPGVELLIVDPESGTDVALPAMEVGEIKTRSPYSMLGYWNKPEETAATIDKDRWLSTGDAGYLDSDGYLFLHDRIKDMIVSGGENIYPAEVENVLLSHPLVADAAVIGIPDDKWGETVKAVVVRDPAAGDQADPAAESSSIIEHCRARLAHYKCPGSVDFVASLPRNPTGKVLKRELRAPYWSDSDRRIN